MKKINLILIALLLFTCDSKTDNTTEASSFQVKTLLNELTNQQILPAVLGFKNQANTLNLKVENYLTSTNEANLTSLRNQWQETALAYANIYAFNIGSVRDQFMHQALYNWPTLPNALENVMINNSEITEELVSNLSPQIKTLSALEYLLFNNDVATVNNQFFTSQKRKNYLKYTTKEFKAQAERLNGIWTTSENYANTFINNNADGIQGSFNKLYNGLYNLIDTAKIKKVGKPAGLENSTNTNPELLQAYFSELSLNILMENITSVENTYFNPNGLGIDDYVFSITNNSILNNSVQNKLNDIKTAINAIPVPLYNAISTHPTEVETLYNEIEALEILFSVDVRSILSIIITTTDNDGD